jgi:hypothetical protein
MFCCNQSKPKKEGDIVKEGELAKDVNEEDNSLSHNKNISQQM